MAKVDVQVGAAVKQVTVTAEDGYLVLRMPLTEPAASRTGKTALVASTHGNIVTTVQVNGKTVQVGANAFIKA